MNNIGIKKSAIAKWSGLDKWIRINLPVSNSYVATDILITVFLESNSQVKDLFLSIPHSYTAVRYHYIRLLDDGWIEQYLSVTDKRVKHIRPAKKLEIAFDAFADTISSAFISN